MAAIFAVLLCAVCLLSRAVGGGREGGGGVITLQEKGLGKRQESINVIKQIAEGNTAVGLDRKLLKISV